MHGDNGFGYDSKRSAEIEAVPTKDAGSHFPTTFGINGTPVSATINAAAVPVTGYPNDNEYLCIDDILVGSGDTAEILTFTDEKSGKTIMIVRVPAKSTQQLTFRGKLKLPSRHSRLYCQSSAADTSDINVGYHSEP